jgi:hypothetical protein
MLCKLLCTYIVCAKIYSTEIAHQYRISVLYILAHTVLFFCLKAAVYRCLEQCLMV